MPTTISTRSRSRPTKFVRQPLTPADCRLPEYHGASEVLLCSGETQLGSPRLSPGSHRYRRQGSTTIGARENRTLRHVRLVVAARAVSAALDAPRFRSRRELGAHILVGRYDSRPQVSNRAAAVLNASSRTGIGDKGVGSAAVSKG